MGAINVIDLQAHIENNPEYIETVLTELGHEQIRDRGKSYSCCNIDGDNPTGLSILKEGLLYSNFSHGGKGNLFSLVMEEKNCNFPRALELIAGWIGYQAKPTEKIILPFNGFYKNLIKSSLEPELNMPQYTEDDLPSPDSLSKMWLDDGVDLLTQEEFGIRIDHESNRIVIPEYSLDGKLVGAKARYNGECELNERWSMYIPFSKSLTIYGWNENYKYIQDKSCAVIFESEKAVLQARSSGLKIGLAIGGHDFSSTQIKYLRSLFCNKLIVAFDEGISEEEIRFQCEKLKLENKLVNTRVGYIYDRNNEYLESGSKDSPADMGGETLRSMIKECVVWI